MLPVFPLSKAIWPGHTEVARCIDRYICLGKRALFLIDFEPPFQEQFYYAWVQRVIIDSDNLLLFQIDFHEGRAPLLLESFERTRLCDELAICWKADSMFRNWRWQPFPLKRGPCDVAKRERTATEFTSPPDKMKRVELRGYLLFLDDAYRADPPGPDGLPTGRTSPPSLRHPSPKPAHFLVVAFNDYHVMWLQGFVLLGAIVSYVSLSPRRQQFPDSGGVKKTICGSLQSEWRAARRRTVR